MSVMTDPETDDAETVVLYNADPDCDHDVQPQWSGVKCTKCSGWFCY